MLGIFLLTQHAFAQSNVISGIVSDEFGSIPEVSVIIKSSKIGTQTNFDGKYTIQVTKGETLVFA